MAFAADCFVIVHATRGILAHFSGQTSEGVWMRFACAHDSDGLTKGDLKKMDYYARNSREIKDRLKAEGYRVVKARIRSEAGSVQDAGKEGK